MATASYHRLPRLHTYTHALHHYGCVKPIRGRTPEERPLGGRQDVNQFKINKLANGDVVCTLYKTDVITYHPDNSVTLNIGTYKPSVSDAYFITAVLGLNARIERRSLVVSRGPKDSNKHFKAVLNNKFPRLTLVSDADGVRMPKDHAVMGWQIDRNHANAVRTQYGEFYRYLRAALSLRKEMNDVGNEVLPITALELKQVLPVTQMDEATLHKAVGFSVWQGLNPTQVHNPLLLWSFNDPRLMVNPLEGKHNKFSFAWRNTWGELVKHFVDCIDTKGKDEDRKTLDFYHAFLWLAFWSSGSVYSPSSRHMQKVNYWADDVFAASTVYRSTPSAMRSALDKVLFMWHSDVVLKYRELAPGQVPNPQFEYWVSE